MPIQKNKITPTPHQQWHAKLNVSKVKQSDNVYLVHLRPECSAPVISEMNKTSYQTFKGSPAVPEVTIPFKSQTFPYVITFRLML